MQVLGIMLATDLVFLAIHAAHVRFDVPGSGLWLISRDRGFPELFQYLKEAAVVALMLRHVRRSASPVYLAWAALFTYLLLDDSLKIHETLGDDLAGRFGFGTAFGIEARDLGQILVSATAGAILFGLVAITAVRDRSPARRLTVRLVAIIAALAFFGVVTDVIDAIDLFGLVEDGGEMIAMSFAVAATLHHRTEITDPKSPIKVGFYPLRR